jgi:hypothetical protein
MIETVGEFYEKKDGSDKPQAWGDKKAIQEEKNRFEDIFLHITGLKNTVSNRIRFMILNMEELRSNNWKPRVGDKGPKTVDAVRNEFEQEQQQNEEERISVRIVFRQELRIFNNIFY